MNSKRVGIVLLVVSIILFIIAALVYQDLSQKSLDTGCFSSPDCQPIQKSFSIVNLGFGAFGFIIALAFYLLFLSKGDEAIVSHLKKEKEKLSNEEKFSILLLGLDEFEKKVIQAVKKQDGITQNTLRLRTDMSKAKLSQELTNLEKKGLIKPEQQKKTLAIFLKINF